MHSFLLLALLLQQPSTVRPDLSRALEEAPPGATTPVYAVLAARPDYRKLGNQLASLPRGERGRELSQRLRAHDAAARGAILEALASAGDASAIRELHVANAVAFRAGADTIRTIAAMPGVGYVEHDPEAPEGSTADVPPAPMPAAPAAPALGAPTIPWNLTMIGAPECWELGYNGRGALVAIIEDGVASDHPSLAARVWKNPGEVPSNSLDDDANGFVDDVMGWDFADNDALPYGGGHGTNVAGIVAGDGTLTDAFGQQIVTGVAPSAKIMLLRLGGAQSTYWSCQQYAIENGADAVSSSHSWKWPSTPDYFLWRALADAELAAGMIHSNSIGNQGFFLSSYPIPFNIATPGNCPAPWPHPAQVEASLSAVLGVAGVLSDDSLYQDSGVGPAAWEDISQYNPSYPYPQNPALFDYPYAFGALPGLLKPDIAAPTNVPTTSGNQSYTSSFGGTSGAQPHIGGALAVLIGANPRLEPRHAAHALQATALDLGPPGKDVRFGAGRLRLREALERAVVSVTCVPQNVTLNETVTFAARTLVGKTTILVLALDDTGSSNPITGPIDMSVPFAILAEGVSPVPDVDLFALPIPPAPALVGVKFFVQMVVDDTAGPFGKWLVSPIEWFEIGV